MSETAVQPPLPVWTVPERLAKARASAGISRDEMAHRLRVSERTIRNYENAKTAPTLAVMHFWAEITGVPLWWIEGSDSADMEAMSSSRCTAQSWLAAA